MGKSTDILIARRERERREREASIELVECDCEETCEECAETEARYQDMVAALEEGE